MSSKQYEQAADIYTRLLKQRACHDLPRPLASDMIQKVEEVGEEVFRRSDTTFLDVDVIDPNLILKIAKRLQKHGHSKENIESRVFGIARFAACKNRVEKELTEEDWDIKIVRIRRLSDLNIEELQRILKNKIGVVEFDVVAGNPPYQKGDSGTGGNIIWHKFVDKALDLVKKNGVFSLVHPALWRKPQSSRSKCADIQPRLLSKDVRYININDSETGEKYFGAGTRFDFYVVVNTKTSNSKTTVIDETGREFELNVSNWKWIPNRHFDLVEKIVAGDNEETCEVIQDYSYGVNTPKDYIEETEQGEYKHKLVHSTADQETRFYYTNTTERGHFGKSKVIVSDSSVEHPVVDLDGECGMTHHGIGLQVENKEEAEKMVKALKSKTFEKILSACSWSNFQIDWRMFRDFKEDWYETVLEIEKQRNDD